MYTIYICHLYVYVCMNMYDIYIHIYIYVQHLDSGTAVVNVGVCFSADHWQQERHVHRRVYELAHHRCQREHLPEDAYVSIRQHTPAYARIRQHEVSIRQHPAASGSIRQHRAAYVSIRAGTLRRRHLASGSPCSISASVRKMHLIIASTIIMASFVTQYSQ